MSNVSRDRNKRKQQQLEEHHSKRNRSEDDSELDTTQDDSAGKIMRVFMRNFMCHDAMEIVFNPNINFIVGRNGSGKSAVLTALTVGLGARASITSRGTSIKEFIKKGKNSATVEITLFNTGPSAYKQEEYGDCITVVRTIGASSVYKLKNWRGEVISTRRDELDRIICRMNIQVDNPISVLNQDISRTFLVTADPREKYRLFMKATQLDVIGDNYKRAYDLSENAQRHLNDAKERLTESKHQVDNLEKNLKELESVDESIKEYDRLQHELQWCVTAAEERKLEQLKKNLRVAEEKVKAVIDKKQHRDSRIRELNNKIQELNKTVKSLEHKLTTSLKEVDAAKQRLTESTDIHANKTRDWKTARTTLDRLQEDMKKLTVEIQQLEGGGDQQDKRQQIKQTVSKYMQQLDEVEAMLRTKQTDQMHLEADKVRLQQDERSTFNDREQCHARAQKIQRELSNLKQDTDNTLMIYGGNMPHLVNRIQQEFRKGRFKEMPRGPIGSYVKLKDPTWAAAVEDYIGAGSLRSFCVDNQNDAKTLTNIMREVLRNEPMPHVICSKFFHQVHNVSRKSTGAPEYSNLLDVIEVSDPIVANCLIDQREPECTLLIPTNEEACNIMSNFKKVPPNCARAITKNADLFFPDPNYRSYGGKPGLRAKYLQASTAETIRMLEEDLVAAQEELNSALDANKAVRERQQRNAMDLKTAVDQVTKLRSMQTKLRSNIEALNDECESIQPPGSLQVFKSELEELEKTAVGVREKEKRLLEKVEEAKKTLRIQEVDVQKHESAAQEIRSRIASIEDEIRGLNAEKGEINTDIRTDQELKTAEAAVQKYIADVEVQNRVVEKAVDDASKRCDRIETQRSMETIKEEAAQLKMYIEYAKKNIGTKEQLKRDLKVKKSKYLEAMQFATKVERTNNKHLRRLVNRKKMYHEMKELIGEKVQEAFKNVLSLRQYKGGIQIDHSSRVLHLEVSAENDAPRPTNDARCLSGGERSYSTVAFILALWECTGLPFYFLDEFDVFMDKVNRKVIMDILMDHARSHQRSQFTFLTPLDTSSIVGDELITIHKLAPPERSRTTVAEQ
ncbi:structural maintenance of chromosomes protein 6 [Orussus abietinus]|uniref:structural maintenance of chromosomes protein 6 n=1 Tax=Orussus abietinus TaxID=222816 RepID=UPI000626C116|nr:structural maintenance of chromosomes protein 6 [Orussus abietinus]